MNSKKIKSDLDYYKNKIDIISNTVGIDKLEVSFDRLLKKNTKVNQELIYFKTKTGESKGLFIFGHDFFIQELKDQEFKTMLGFNSLNFQIYASYSKLKQVCDLNSKCKGVKVSEIISDIINNTNKSNVSKPKLLRRILTLSYYLKWNLKQDNKFLDTEYFIELPTEHIQKQKQRFNLDIAINIDENQDYLLFVNKKGDLCIVLKKIEKFDKKTIENDIFNYIKKILNIKKIISE